MAYGLLVLYTKATDTLLECVMLIASPLQQWLHKRASVLRYKYTVRPVCYLETGRIRLKFIFRMLSEVVFIQTNICFEVCKCVHRHIIQINQPNRCKQFL
jgi:hypothetical protein